MSTVFSDVRPYVREFFVWLLLVFIRWLYLGCGPITTVIGVWQYYHDGKAAPFWWVTGFFFVLAAFLVWLSERKPPHRLELYHRDNHDQHQRVGSNGEVMFRVGVREKNGLPVQGVRVRIEKIELLSGQGISNDEELTRRLGLLTDVPLHRKHDNVQPYSQSFDLPREDSVDVDVIGERVERDGWAVCPALPDGQFERQLPFSEYRLTIKASGGEAEPDEKKYRVGIDGQNRITFRLEPTAPTAIPSTRSGI